MGWFNFFLSSEDWSALLRLFKNTYLKLLRSNVFLIIYKCPTIKKIVFIFTGISQSKVLYKLLLFNLQNEYKSKQLQPANPTYNKRRMIYNPLSLNNLTHPIQIPFQHSFILPTSLDYNRTRDSPRKS